MSGGASDRATLNLPRTAFPARANPATLEPALVKRWQDEDTWGAALRRHSGPAFVLGDGPLTAVGHLHLGHALNRVLKDIVVKYRTLAGQRCHFTPAWDCHALGVQRAAEDQLARLRVDTAGLSLADVARRCREVALQQVSIQRAELQRLGIAAGREEPLLTLSPAAQARALRTLAALAEQGCVQRRAHLVLWCVVDQAPVAQAEVELRDVEVPSVHLAFPAAEDLGASWPALSGREVAFAVWTTRPWTLPAHQALGVGRDVEYVFYDVGARVLCLARELLLPTLARVAPDHLGERQVSIGQARLASTFLRHPDRILAYASGEELLGLRYRHPLSPFTGRVVDAPHASARAGTGLLHLAPAHSPEDFAAGLAHGLSLESPLRPDGTFADAAGPLLAGRGLVEANRLLVEQLDEARALLDRSRETLVTSAPHSRRSGRPLIHRATPHWVLVLDAARLRARTLAGVEASTWAPEWASARLAVALSTRPDWALSRHRAWGVPIPFAVCSACHFALLEPALVRRVADVVETQGPGAWHALSLAELRPDGPVCPRCAESALKKETDVLDPRFDAAALAGPADLCVEGADQLESWFPASLMLTTAAGRSPARTLLAHGVVRDGRGKKLSRATAGDLALEPLLRRHGAELVRLWVASRDVRRDVRAPRDLEAEVGPAYRRLRGALRFALGNLSDFHPARHAVAPEALHDVDAWVLARLEATLEQVRAAYEAYRFHQVTQGALAFCARELSRVYFEAVKQRLYTSAPEGPARRSAQTALWHVCSRLLVALAPILSFTAEEAWGHLPGAPVSSAFLADFPGPTAVPRPAAVAEVEWLVTVRASLLPLLERAPRHRRVALHAASASTEERLAKGLSTLEELLPRCEVELSDSPLPYAVGPSLTAEVRPLRGARSKGTRDP